MFSASIQVFRFEINTQTSTICRGYEICSPIQSPKLSTWWQPCKPPSKWPSTFGACHCFPQLKLLCSGFLLLLSLRRGPKSVWSAQRILLSCGTKSLKFLKIWENSYRLQFTNLNSCCDTTGNLSCKTSLIFPIFVHCIKYSTMFN